MEQKAKATNSIVEGVIWKSLLAFFFPILLGTFFQQMYNTVDSVVVGNFVGKEALAAVGGSAAQILNLLIGFFTGIGSGATVVVSQYYGADDADGVHRAVHTAIAVAVLGGLMMTVLGLLCAPTMLRWMDTPPETMEDSALYLRIIFLGMIPAMIYNIGSGIQRAVGDSRRPLYFLIVCCVLNIVLDMLFVLVFRMGVAGVAIATTLAQVVSAMLVCASLGRSKDIYRLEMRRVRLDRVMTRETIRIGLPSGLQSVLFALSNILITTSINGFGTSTVAAWVALGKVDAMNWMIVGAFGVSVTTFVGQNYGARRYERVSKSMRVCMVLCEATTILFSLLAVCFSRQIFSLFTQDEEVLETSIRMLNFMVKCYWLYVPIEMISGTLRGTGNVLVPTMITALGICGIRVVWMLAVVPHWHVLESIMFSYPFSWILTSLAFVVYYLKTRKRLLPAQE